MQVCTTGADRRSRPPARDGRHGGRLPVVHGITRPAPGRAGFSLIELVIVVAILAVVTAIAVPRFGHAVEGHRADAAADRLVADLEYARRTATRVSAPRTVDVDVALDRYVLQDIADFKHGDVPYVIDLIEPPYEARIVSADLDDPDVADDPVDEIIFDGYGRPDSGGTIVIKAGNTTRTVVIDADTGVASVQ